MIRYLSIRLRRLVHTSLTLLWVGSLSAITWFIYDSNSRLVLSLADDFIDRAVAAVIVDVQNVVDPVIKVVKTTAQLGMIDPKLLHDRASLRYLFEVLQNYPQILSFHMGFAADGRHLQVVQLPPGQERFRIDDIDLAIPLGARFVLRVTDPTVSPPVNEYTFLTEWGKPMLADGFRGGSYDPRDRNWYKNAVARNGLQVSGIARSLTTGRRTFSASLPFYDARGKVLGVVSANVTVDSMSAFLAAHLPSTHGVSFIVDERGQVIAHPQLHQPLAAAQSGTTGADRLMASELSDPAVAKALRLHQAGGSERIRFEIGEPGRDYIAVFRRFPPDFAKPWQIVTVVPTDDFVGELKNTNRLVIILALVLIMAGAYFLVVRNSTLQRRVEARTRDLEDANRTKSLFLAAAAHDLRQPLASANLFIGTLKFTKPSPNQSEIIENLEDAMSNFEGMLNALLNISKLESGSIEPEFGPVAVADIALWLKQSFAPMAQESGLGFKLRFPAGNLVVQSDFNLIKQVLANLVSNAIKYTPQGAILVSARRRGTNVLFQVWDTGIGIEADQFEHIFKGFYQIHNPQSDCENGPGLGLGLVIVKRSLALLGVEITCRSQFGRGSVFGFSLPLDEVGQAPHRPALIPALDEMEAATFARGKRFVVLENDRLVAQGISRLLETMGGQVELFKSAEEALRCADIEEADYFICDYTLDGALNGLQFLNQLRQKRGTTLKAILLSGDTSPTFVREMKNCAWPVLSKPVNASRLIYCLNVQKHIPPERLT